jgi:hypothetical protein
LAAQPRGCRARPEHPHDLPQGGRDPGWLSIIPTSARSASAATPSGLAGACPADQVRLHREGWFSGVRSFSRWLVAGGEAAEDVTAGIKTPPPAEPRTRVLSEAELRRLLRTVERADFASRRDAAVLLLFLDGRLRLAELAGLQLGDVDLADRIVFVAGKGSQPSGPRLRAIPLGAKATRGRWTATSGRAAPSSGRAAVALALHSRSGTADRGDSQACLASRRPSRPQGPPHPCVAALLGGRVPAGRRLRG